MGLPSRPPTSIAAWVKRKVADQVHPGRASYLADAPADKIADCERFAALLSEVPIELSFLGIGENGLIAFNDPRNVNSADSKKLKVVTLGDRCRLQQVGEGYWPNQSSLPLERFTITALWRRMGCISFVVCQEPRKPSWCETRWKGHSRWHVRLPSCAIARMQNCFLMYTRRRCCRWSSGAECLLSGAIKI